MTLRITATRLGDSVPGGCFDGRRRGFGLVAACWLAPLAAGCSNTPAEPPPPAFTATDSAGVRVVVNSGQQWSEGEGWQVTAEPLVTLGVLDYPIEQQFQNIVGATRLSDGTIVIVELADFGLRAFNAAGELLWMAGGVGDGPGEMRSYPDTRPVLSRLDDDILQAQNGLERIRYGSGGDVLEHGRLDYARFLRWGRIFIQYCPFDAYFVRDQIVVCHSPRPDPVPDSWTREHTIMRTTWDLDGLDTLGVFLERNLWAERRVGLAVRSPLGPQGVFHVSGGPEPKLLYARNDAYRIQFWDLKAGSLSMVVERQVPRRARTDEEADFLVRTGDLWSMRNYVDMAASLDRARSTAIDSVSIAEGLLLDELGFTWVRRGPSPLDGDHARQREVTGSDDMHWTISAPSGLHDVIRPDGVYLGAVKLPHELRITEIGADYILGVVRDEMDVQYVWMYGLDRGRAEPG